VLGSSDSAMLFLGVFCLNGSAGGCSLRYSGGMKKPDWLIGGGDSDCKWFGSDGPFGIPCLSLRRIIHRPARRRRVPRIVLAIMTSFLLLKPDEDKLDAPRAVDCACVVP